MARPFRTEHPAVKTTDETKMIHPAQEKPTKREASWRARFRDENGLPLPPDPIRIDVTTGEVVDDEPPASW